MCSQILTRQIKSYSAGYVILTFYKLLCISICAKVSEITYFAYKSPTDLHWNWFSSVLQWGWIKNNFWWNKSCSIWLCFRCLCSPISGLSPWAGLLIISCLFNALCVACCDVLTEIRWPARSPSLSTLHTSTIGNQWPGGLARTQPHTLALIIALRPAALFIPATNKRLHFSSGPFFYIAPILPPSSWCILTGEFPLSYLAQTGKTNALKAGRKASRAPPQPPDKS